MVYREMVYQIYVNSMKFQKAGVSVQELNEQLENVRQHLKSDILTDASADTQRVQLLVDELTTNLEQAQRVLDNVD